MTDATATLAPPPPAPAITEDLGPGLGWSEALALRQPQVDQTHEEFVALLEATRRALADGLGDEAGLQAFDALYQHTIEHFGQEDRWMADCGFDPVNCHARQHAQVLEVMREVLRHGRELGSFVPLHIAVRELALWFPVHASAMDAGLVDRMEQLGYDPLSGRLPQALPEGDKITGCGGGSCH